SEKCNQDRLAEKLDYQLAATRAGRFADAYFFCPFLRPRSAQVHKIDAGQQQYKNADNAKQPYKLNIAACVNPIFKLGVQVPSAHGLQKQGRFKRYAKQVMLRGKALEFYIFYFC